MYRMYYIPTGILDDLSGTIQQRKRSGHVEMNLFIDTTMRAQEQASMERTP